MHGHNTKRRQIDWAYCENKQDIVTEPAFNLQDIYGSIKFYRVYKSFREISPFFNFFMIPVSDEKIGRKSNHVFPVDCSLL